MLDILFSPLEAIARAKKEKNVIKTFVALFVASVSSSIFSLNLAKYFGHKYAIMGVTFGGALLLTIIIAFLLELCMNILTPGGGYYEAITSLSYSFFIMSTGLLISFLIGWIPKHNKYIALFTMIISISVLLVTCTLSSAVLLRAVTALFQTNLLTAIIALSIVYSAVFLALYLFALKNILASYGMLSLTPSIRI